MADIESTSWSETAASNNTATPNGFPEGQPASTLNDCSREVMAALKRDWNRNHPTITSGGTNTITLTYTTAPTAYVLGQTYSFIAGGNNSGATTLNVNGLGAKNITKSGTTALAGGEILSGAVVTVMYDGTQFQLTDGVLSTTLANTVPNGLTGQVTFAAHAVLLGNGTSGLAVAAPSTSGFVLTDNGAGSDPSFQAVSSVSTGIVTPYAGRTAPSGYLLCDGTAVSRSTNSALFAVMCPTIGTFTVTLASPGVWTLNGHGLQTGEKVRLTTTGALPTGLSLATDYFIIRTGANTGNFATTLANANAGTAVNTSVSQSGTHTMQYFGYGAGDGSTTFNVPDLRGSVPLGADAMNGSPASRVTFATSGYNGGAIGSLGGEQAHTLSTPEIPSHTHDITGSSANLTTGGATTYLRGSSTGVSSGSTGGGGAHNNVQPFQAMNYIIKT